MLGKFSKIKLTLVTSLTLVLILFLLATIISTKSMKQQEHSYDTSNDTQQQLLHRTVRQSSMRARIAADNLRQEMVKGPPGPVIGILTQVFRDYKDFMPERHLHLAASYVKWIEATGARVLPILLNQDDDYYNEVFKLTNGLLLPGGDNLLDPNKRTPMMVAAKKLYKMAIEANDKGDYYPIWGTCLGLELLSVLSSNINALSLCEANDLALKMEFVSRGSLFAERHFPGLPETIGFDYSKLMMDLMARENLTYNYHHFCLTDSDLKVAKLEQFYQPLAYSYDNQNIKFISAFEAFKYPIYGVQFHPEKAPFEFVVRKHQINMPHGEKAVTVSRYFADFFISKAKLNQHRPRDLKSLEILRKSLIYSYTPQYFGIEGDIYEQRYLFPYTEREGISDEEFIDEPLEEGQEIPEGIGSRQLTISSTKNCINHDNKDCHSLSASSSKQPKVVVEHETLV